VAAAATSPRKRQQIRRVRTLPVRTTVTHNAAAAAATHAAAVDDVGQLVARLAVKLFIRIAYTKPKRLTLVYSSVTATSK